MTDTRALLIGAAALTGNGRLQLMGARDIAVDRNTLTEALTGNTKRRDQLLAIADELEPKLYQHLMPVWPSEMVLDIDTLRKALHNAQDHETQERQG